MSRAEVSATLIGTMPLKPTLSEVHGRNFSVLYFLMAGLESDEKEMLGLEDEGSYDFIEQSQRRPEDADGFVEVMEALQDLRLDGYIQNIFEILAAVLLMPQLNFDDSGADGCTIAAASVPMLNKVAELLGLDLGDEPGDM